jgi:putative hemolysin
MKLIIFCLVSWVFIVLPVRASDIRLAMANPAAVACLKAGGKLTKIYTDKGEQSMCTLPSGVVCEEWAFFKGTCACGRN